jgi:ATP-dependent Clp protease ATP-binding subunit ClpA
MTSNVGTEKLISAAPLGFHSESAEEKKQRDRVMQRLRETFRPEFLNRIDEVVIFHPLNKTQAEAITRLQINDLAARLLEQGLVLKAEDSAIELLCQEGFSQTQGARPLRRAIERLLTVPLSLRILLANLPQNGEVHVRSIDDKLEIDIREPEQPQDAIAQAEVEAS